MIREVLQEAKVKVSNQGDLNKLLKEMGITHKADPRDSAWFPGGVSEFFGSIQKNINEKL